MMMMMMMMMKCMITINIKIYVYIFLAVSLGILKLRTGTPNYGETKKINYSFLDLLHKWAD